MINDAANRPFPRTCGRSQSYRISTCNSGMPRSGPQRIRSHENRPSATDAPKSGHDHWGRIWGTRTHWIWRLHEVDGAAGHGPALFRLRAGNCGAQVHFHLVRAQGHPQQMPLDELSVGLGIGFGSEPFPCKWRRRTSMTSASNSGLGTRAIDSGGDGLRSAACET
jgi:hypothetical protein